VNLGLATKKGPYFLGSLGQAQLPLRQEFFFRFAKKRMTVRATIPRAAGVCQSMVSGIT
jgi:hypothetical protein